MDPVALKTFVDLMESRSFNRSADRLGVRQSTVSHRITKLEDTLGQTLFLRSRSGTEPTKAGLRFLPHARNLLQDWSIAKRHMRLAERLDDSIRIGLQHDIGDAVAHNLVADLRKRLPGTAIYLEMDYSTQMASDVIAGDLDIAFVFSPHPSADLFHRQLGEIWYQLVSDTAQNVQNITAEHYVFPNYSPELAAMHRACLPHLSNPPVAMGQGRGVARFLEAYGGHGYITMQEAARLEARTALRPVLDAELLCQPVYAVMGVRRRHLQSLRRIEHVVQRALVTAAENASLGA